MRLSGHASESRCKQATITLDTELAGNPQASNTAELLLAALSACMIKSMESISHEIIVDTDEPDRRLDLLHENVKKFGTVFNAISPGTELTGVLHRMVEPS